MKDETIKCRYCGLVFKKCIRAFNNISCKDSCECLICYIKRQEKYDSGYNSASYWIREGCWSDTIFDELKNKIIIINEL